MLIYKVGAYGMNLQTANHVIPVDPWWNYIVEQQAEGRAWRDGQIRQVNIHRIIMKGTIEEQIRAIAIAKNQNSQFYYGKSSINDFYKLPSLDKETLGKILFESLKTANLVNDTSQCIIPKISIDRIIPIEPPINNNKILYNNMKPKRKNIQPSAC